MADETQQLGKYRIADVLGQGGFATVYRAVDTTLDRDVALKILHPQLLVDGLFVQRFLGEARTVANLRHPNVITVYEVAEADGRLFIAMELARGPSLARIIDERKQVPWHETLMLLKPVCAALDYAHTQNIVHRDLKPSNILLDEETPMLTDFGFARLMGENSVSLSMSGGITGTPGYIAPEVWEYNAAERPADIYALGCVVCELLTGRSLFTGETPMQVMRAHDRGPAFPDEWPADVPAGIERVLRTALAQDPHARYTTATALWQALADLEETASSSERNTLVMQWRTETENALEAGEWRVARMALRRWEALAPDDPAVQATHERLESVASEPAEADIGDQEPEQPARDVDLEDLYNRARRKIAAQRWTPALWLLKKIQAVEPGFRDTDGLLAQTNAEMARADEGPQRPEAAVASAEVDVQRPTQLTIVSWGFILSGLLFFLILILT